MSYDLEKGFPQYERFGNNLWEWIKPGLGHWVWGHNKSEDQAR